MDTTRAIDMVNEKLKDEGGLVAINYIAIGANAKSSNRFWFANIGNEWSYTADGLKGYDLDRRSVRPDYFHGSVGAVSYPFADDLDWFFKRTWMIPEQIDKGACRVTDHRS